MEEQKEELCCAITPDANLGQSFWDKQYQDDKLGWDLGMVSPPLKTLIDGWKNKHQNVLIPGAGNAYEAAYLLEQGFTNVTVIDIAPTVVDRLQKQYINNPNINIVLGDFFMLEGQYDLIIEQTFFCALPPAMRQRYVSKMHELLTDNGVLSGLLFNRTFDAGPPFGGSKEEYEALFASAFLMETIEPCTNSVAPRAGSELLVALKKNPHVHVALYDIEGITCSGCTKTVTARLKLLPNVKNISINTTYKQVLVVSEFEVPIETLRDALAFDEKYKISKN